MADDTPRDKAISTSNFIDTFGMSVSGCSDHGSCWAIPIPAAHPVPTSYSNEVGSAREEKTPQQQYLDKGGSPQRLLESCNTELWFKKERKQSKQSV